MQHQKWQVFPPVSAETLAHWPDLPPLMVQLLHNRGVTERAQLEPFLAADERLLVDPFLLPDMDLAVARVRRALQGDELIAAYGDSDTDGITAAAVLAEGLSALGGKVIPYIPHRIEEGYGLNHAALETLHKQGVSLVITGDCGISSYSEVERAQEMGLDIIITDHHTVPSKIPPALAAVNPKRTDSSYPFPDLAGVGVAFKLIQALLEAADQRCALDQLMDLVALGTVADLVSLTEENRYLVKRGLEVLNQTNRLGLREMAICASVHLGDLDTESIAYVLGPRLNAAGRLDHAIISYQLLRTTSPEEAHQLAFVLEEKNLERKRLTAEILDKAKSKLLPFTPEMPLLMIGGEDYSQGVIGVVAGKLAEEFYRPVFILQLGETESRGSARSIPEFNVIEAISQCQELLSRFGGHARAAGFSIPNSNIELFHQRLLELAANQLANVELRPTLAIDAEVPLSSLGGDTFRQINRLGPFGNANQAPTFLSRGVKVLNYRGVGVKGNHLRLKLREGNVTWNAIAFDLSNFAEHLIHHIDVVYNLQVEDWSGTRLLQLNVLDFVPSI